MTDETLLPLDEVEPHLQFSRWVGRLVNEHRSKLVRVALSEGLTAQEALDAVQDGLATFIQNPEWRTLPRDTPDAERLLSTLVRNHARNRRRQASRGDGAMDDLTEAQLVDHETKALEDLMGEAEEHIRLTGCIATLKEVQRAVVMGRFFEGASGQEVAKDLGLTAGNVAVILHRARASLRTCLEASRENFGLTAPVASEGQKAKVE